jgi:enoyl-CoA hydratase/carnithine racemase
MIKISRENNILEIQIHRPEKKNALNPQMYREMAMALESVSENNDKVVLIKGSNHCFTAGNDISDFASNAKAEDVTVSHRFMLALLKCKVPVIAQVQGMAIGIGTTLLLHCDFVYCDESAKFAMPFINLGLVPEYASSYILPRISGNLAAAELLMLGEAFNAEKALKCGIITECVSAEDIDMHVKRVLSKLVALPSKAMQQTKMLLRNQESEITQHIETELKIFAEAMVSKPAKEAFAAFLEKRPINTEIYK